MTVRVTKDLEGNRLVVERSYEASADLVWACWTRPEHLRRWWGPHGWLVDVFELDLRPGGSWRYRLRPEAEHGLGEEQWGQATYRVVDAPHRLEFDDAFTDPSGLPVEGSEMPTAVRMATSGGRTSVTITVTFTAAARLEQAEAIGMVEGFSDALERLAAEVTTTAEARPAGPGDETTTEKR
ncbi:SRPBCC family protein [Promicromonospora sukumoe]|uniref:SRPBCC family protein n=1 Tax=Promicromonospora sukumoe TaxID=88382 RepID=UPI00036C3FB4|nr:SRPBCC domain-containing protein [Promicromonospora sukumoe]